MRKLKAALAALFAACILTSAAPSALAADVRVMLGGTRFDSFTLREDTTYVPLRAVCERLLPGARVSWEDGAAWVRDRGLELCAVPGDCWINANGRALYAEQGVILENGTTLLPVRTLAKAIGASVSWDASRRLVTVSAAGEYISPGAEFYDAGEVYWLSRIIEAESGGEPMRGKIAVGNCVLNRVASRDYPNSIYGVIFDRKWGVQFEPVANGTIYNNPSPASTLAAKLCLDGAAPLPDALFFLNPVKATNNWITENRSYIETIGAHEFYR